MIEQVHDYGYDIQPKQEGWGFLSVFGDVVAIHSAKQAWPRCMCCDSTSCLHIQEMYSRAKIRMPDAVFD